MVWKNCYIALKIPILLLNFGVLFTVFITCLLNKKNSSNIDVAQGSIMKSIEGRIISP